MFPKVSVIIPTYNRKQFVTKAVESVFRQGFKDYEIIVVDDGSTDNTWRVLEPFRSRIHYIYQANAGVSAARNAGIRQARGEWLAFLDSDDEWMPDYLSAQMGHVLKFPQAVMHITNAVHIVPNEEPTNHFKAPLMKKFKQEALLVLEKPFGLIMDDRFYWFLQSSIFRRDLLLQSGLFDEKLSIAEDLDVIGRIALTGPVTLCSQVRVAICRREESVENLVSQHRTKTEYCYRAYEKVYASFLGRNGLSITERVTVSRALCSYRRALGNLLLTEGKKIEARQVFRNALCVYPSVRALIKYLATFLPQTMSRLFVVKMPSPGPNKKDKRVQKVTLPG